MLLVLNELTFEPARTSVATAQRQLSDMISLVRAIHNLGAERVLKVPRTLRHTLLSHGYTMAHWLDGVAGVPRDERVFLKTVGTKAPYVEEVLAAATYEQGKEYEFRFEGRQTSGLGAAYLVDAPCVGLAGGGNASEDPLKVDVVFCDDDQIVDCEVDVCNICTSDQFKAREAWLRERIDQERKICDGGELWNRRAACFPQLLFCESTKSFLCKLNGREQFFPGILRHLATINEYAAMWSEGPFDVQGVKWSNETAQTLDHGTYGPKRLIKCPDGVDRVFSPHSKIIGSNMRIHFRQVDEKNQVWIGYVGPHLPY